MGAVVRDVLGRAVAVATAVGVVLSLVACTSLQEEVRISNPCGTEISVWLSDSPPPPGSDDYGRRIEAASSAVLTHDPDEPVQQIWVSVGGAGMQLVEDTIDFSAFIGDAMAQYDLPISVCTTVGD